MPEQSLRILLVDPSDSRMDLLRTALADCGFSHVTCVRTTEDVLERVFETNPDVILIDVESPTRDTLEQLTSIQQQQPKPVVMFTQDQNVQSIQAAIRSGVSAYVTNGISPAEVRPAIDVAMATFQQFQSVRHQAADTFAELDSRAVVERAKGALMREHQISEDQAYHLLRRTAMNRKTKLATVARDFLTQTGLT